MSMYRVMADHKPEMYPERMGEKWGSDEITKLLSSIENKTSIEDIAKEHRRTVGGINTRRRCLAVDYWFNEKKSKDEIMRITGLTLADIDDAIKRKESALRLKKIIEENKNEIPNTTESLQSKEIAELKEEVLSLKKDVKEMLRLMNALYDFESQ